MKFKYVLIPLITAFLGLIFFSILKFYNKPDISGVSDDISLEENILVQESPFAKLNKPIYGTPKRILFDSLDLKLEVIRVGVSGSGSLETPNDWDIAGWYYKSARPSESGNLIINAHYDDNYGHPAAFWQLKNINIDDKVSVIDSFGRFHDYKVKDKFYVDMTDPDRLDVVDLESNEGSQMTLITCGGVYYPAQGYNKRLVVQAELIQD